MQVQAPSAADRLQLDQRRAAVAAKAVSVLAGLRWRHVLTLAPALIVMTVCGVGLAGAFWGHAADELASSRQHLRDLLPAFLVGYLAAALIAAWAWARFDARHAARRLPLVLVFGSVGILVLLASSLVHISAGTEGGSPGGSTTEASKPVAPPATLATLLLNQQEAAAIVGAEVAEAGVQGAGMMRGGSICRYRALDRSATLTVIVREMPSGSGVNRLLRRGEPLPDLGDRAATFRGGVYAVSDGWLLALSVRRRDRGPIDQPALVEAARRALALLPQPAEVTSA